MLAANEEEDRTLQRLEKQLKLNKVKNKRKAFEEDGLDFLLDVCDSGRIAELSDLEDEEDMKDMEEGSNDEQSEDEEEFEREEEIGFDGDDQNMEEDDSEQEVMESEGEEMENDIDDDDSEEDDDGENDDVGEESMDDKESEEEEMKSETWEDIYGKTRGSSGEEIKTTKYIPPALRAKMVGSDDEKRKEALRKLKNQLQGLLNRLATTNLGGIARQIEDVYGKYSRNDTNETLFNLLSDSIVSPVITPERLIMEHALLIGILQVNVGAEVGATMLQSFAKQFYERYQELKVEDGKFSFEGMDKKLLNGLLFIAHLYSFKVVDSFTLFDLCDLFAENFHPRDIELNEERMNYIFKEVGKQSYSEVFYKKYQVIKVEK